MAQPTEYHAHCKNAQSCLRRREYAQAVSHYQKALETDSRGIEAHEGISTAYFLTEDYESAIQHFNQMNRIDPSQGRAFINLGAVYNRLGEYQKAVEALRKGLGKEYNSSEGYYNLGIAHRRLNQLSMAATAYREAVRLNPQMAEAHQNLGNVFQEMGNYQQAVSHYQKALEIRPDFAKAERGLEKAEKSLVEAQEALSPLGRLVEESTTIGAHNSPTAGRQLTEQERQHDRLTIQRLAQEVVTAAEEFLETGRGRLESQLLALSKAVAEGADAKWDLAESHRDFREALSEFTAAQKNLQQKTEELRTHEQEIVSLDTD